MKKVLLIVIDALASRVLPGVSLAERVRGPSVLALADFAQSVCPGTQRQLKASGGVLRRFGFHDHTTAEYLLDLADADPFPDFTLAYFPNNDYRSHEVGPGEAVSVVEEIDSRLDEFFTKSGGLDQFLERCAVVIVGDHAQCDMHDDASQRAIDLSRTLGNYNCAAAGAPWSESDDLMVCPNMRAAQIYLRDPHRVSPAELARELCSEPLVDQVIWREPSWSRERGANALEYHVTTRDRGSLNFRHSQSGLAVTDTFGNCWEYSGDPECVDASTDEAGNVHFNAYPNAFERIAGAFSDVSGDLWVTARAGSEFCLPETSVHPGGSHGSLQKDDSESLLITGGIEENLIPTLPRITDLKPLCLEVLGVGTGGASHSQAVGLC